MPTVLSIFELNMMFIEHLLYLLEKLVYRWIGFEDPDLLAPHPG